MNLSEGEVIGKNAKKCGNCNPNTFLAYEFEINCISCGFNLIKRKYELSKIQRKEINFKNRLKYAELKKYSICVDVCKIHEGKNNDIIYEVLSPLKNIKVKLKKNPN